MESRKIFHIQDDDRPMFVIANDWAEALTKWRKLVDDENERVAGESEYQPQGIMLVAETNDIIF